jgi:serine/threonine-protein kinase HipA
VAVRTALLWHLVDRNDEALIPFLSAMSMLGAADNDDHRCLEFVDALRQFGLQPSRIALNRSGELSTTS